MSDSTVPSGGSATWVGAVAAEAASVAAPVFAARGWKYGWNRPAVPDETELTSAVANRVSLLRANGGPSASSGRFEVVPHRRGGVDVYLHIASWRPTAEPPSVSEDV